MINNTIHTIEYNIKVKYTIVENEIFYSLQINGIFYTFLFYIIGRK